MPRVFAGFLAALLAVLLVHQPIIFALAKQGILPATAVPYNMAPTPTELPAVAAFMKSLGFAGWPSLFNSMFWGGLWGILFSIVHTRIPGGLLLIKGLIFGLLITIFSNWMLVPLIKGTLLGIPNTPPFFMGGNPQRMWPGLVINGGFGLGLGFLFSLFRRAD